MHGAIVILTPQAMTDVLETAEILPRVAKTVDKPILASFMGIVDVSAGIEYLEQNSIPNYTFPEAAVRAMESTVRFGNLLRLRRREVRRVAADRESAAQIIKRSLADKDDHFMPENEANVLLQSYGFPVLRSQVVQEEAEIEKAVKDVGFPVAMKIISPDIVHKFDAKGVILKIQTLEEARSAFDEIIENAKKFNPKAAIHGVLVEKMSRGGIEVILGATRNPKFGPVCMFGLGGTFVETHQDVSFRLAPMWEVSVEIMMESTNAFRILSGVRGRGASDIAAVKDCILRLSQMVTDHPEIAELDINPLIVYPEGEGCVVADSRILLTKEPV